MNWVYAAIVVVALIGVLAVWRAGR